MASILIPVDRIDRESELLAVVESVLRERLPDSWTLEFDLGARVAGGMADAVARLKAPDGSRVQFVAEAKLRLDPRLAGEAIRQAMRLTVDLPAAEVPRAAPLIVARFLSPRTRREIAERGANYADATGNIRLVLDRPAVFIANSGAERDPVPDDRPLRSLKGETAARVVLVLFDADMPVKLGDLAKESGASPAQTGRVIELLDRETIVERNSRGSVIAVDRTKLIERWVEDYSFTKTNDTALFLEPRSLDKLLDRLRDAPFQYALTGSFAAMPISEYADAKLAMVYVENIERAAKALDLTRVVGGGNVFLAEPSDSAVFDWSTEQQGLRYAPVGLIAADLLTSPGRGPAEGEELLRVLEARRGR